MKTKTTKDAIRNALRSIENVDDYWAGPIKSGATDQEVMEKIRDIFHLGGGHGSPGLHYEYKGGATPWFIHRDEANKSDEIIGWGHGPKIKGRKLVALAREALGIPQKKTKSQMKLNLLSIL